MVNMMELQKVRNGHGDIMIEPVKAEDKVLFSHCAFGHSNFPNKFFKKEVEPLLKAHGVNYLHVTDRSGKRKFPEIEDKP